MIARPVAHVVVADRQRRHDVQAVEVGERPQPALLARRGQLDHRLVVGAGGVVRHERLAGRPVADQLDGPEHAEPAHLADATGGASAISASAGPTMSSPRWRACSMMPSSLKMLMLATADAQASGWPE